MKTPSRFLLSFCSLCVWLSSVAQPAYADETVLYYAFAETNDFPPSLSSLVLQAPYLDVPAGTAFRVYLLRGDARVATSAVNFPSATRFGSADGSSTNIVQIAAFNPLGTGAQSNEVVPGVTLQAGEADLSAVAAAPAQYRFLFELSAGVIVPSLSTTISIVPFRRVSLKLCALSATRTLGDQKPGSVLFFPRVTSSPTNSLREDTAITLTNTHPASSTQVRLFLVDGTCQPMEFQVCLAAQQTQTFKLSDLDPGIRGYLIAIATDATGKPAQFNWLTGNAALKEFSNGRQLGAVLSAYAIVKRAAGVVAAGTDNTAELAFNDEQYERLPQQLSFDGVPAPGPNVTTLALFRPLPHLGGSSVTGTVQISARNTQSPNAPATGTVALSCYSDTAAGTLRLTPTRIGDLITGEATGWLTAVTADATPLFGTQLNAGAFTGATAARALSFATDYRIKVPLAAVSCGQ